MQVKICGITNLADAQFAIKSGADAVGFIFYKKSNRCIDIDTAKYIVDQIGKSTVTVGVFVNTPASEVNAIARKVNLKMIQLSGSASPDETRKIEIPVINVIHVDENYSIDFDSLSYFNEMNLLVDSKVNGAFGGSGVVAHWDNARMISKNRPIILAGGLTPENVQNAIKIVLPSAVDVSSGVEKSVGMKDRDKVFRFIKNAKNTGIKSDRKIF